MQNPYRSAEYILSAADLKQLPPDQGIEVVFLGCSNVGKSSTINALTDNSKLARASKTPGRTQCINLFRLDDDRRIVDLPGFGYAEVPKRVREQWQKNIDRYLRERECLTAVVLIIDIRTPLKTFEKQMIEWAVKSELPIHIVLNKKDKLSNGAAKNTLQKVEKALKEYKGGYSIQTLSTLKKEGVETLVKQLNEFYNY